jgi:hypothetical protein
VLIFGCNFLHCSARWCNSFRYSVHDFLCNCLGHLVADRYANCTSNAGCDIAKNHAL